MKKAYKTCIFMLSVFLLAAIVAVGQFNVVPTASAVAVADASLNFDNTDIEDDLADLDLTAYPKNALGTPQIFEVVEYCYSDNVFRQNKYGLYVYVYDPAQTVFSTKDNAVNIATHYNADGEPDEYANMSLTFLDKTEGEDSDLFYKFKVTDAAKLLPVLKAYNAAHGERRYDIAGLQLRALGSGVAHDYTVGGTWHYTGYAKGYGADETAGSTLSCSQSDMETVGLEVHDTFYRPKGDDGEDIYTQDQLSSVYFAVPNEIKNRYERLYAVKAEWYKALTDKILVTDNKAMYDDLVRYLGVGGGSYGFGRQNVDHPMYYNDFRTEITDIYEGYIAALNYIFYVTAGQSADDYIVSAEDLKEFILQRSEDCEDKFLDKYDPALFESIDSEKTVAKVTADDEYSLTSRVIGPSWWDELLCNYVTTTYDGIEAIHEVTADDFVKTGSGEIDVEATCRGLYIDRYDYADFREFYEGSTAADKTVYLLRYDLTKYTSVNVNIWTKAQDMFGNYYNAAASGNGYVAQVPAYLDFDVISLTYEREGEYYVIPAVSDPIDIFSDVTPPPNWDPVQPAGSCADALMTLLMIVGIILLAIVVIKLIAWIVKKSGNSEKSGKSRKSRYRRYGKK